jgi:hypothetical protein
MKEQSMDVTIIVAIVALVSTIIGATIGAATTYVLAVRREHADREIESRKHAIEVKRAARLIAEELTWNKIEVKQWVEKKKWSNTDVPLRSLSTEAREKYIDTIAPELSNAAWLSVTCALRAAESMRVINRVPRDRAVAIPDDVAMSYIPLITDMDVGCRALAPFEFDFPMASKSKKLPPDLSSRGDR